VEATCRFFLHGIDPNAVYGPYVGDYFTLRAAGNDFYDTFCASGQPVPWYFPNGVYL
jgi:hypothetical protein